MLPRLKCLFLPSRSMSLSPRILPLYFYLSFSKKKKEEDNVANVAATHISLLQEQDQCFDTQLVGCRGYRTEESHLFQILSLIL